ncbi:MAG: hypothetical protein V4469_03585 [Patescibacteria group bacterium]
MFYIHTAHVTGLMPGDIIRFQTCRTPKKKPKSYGFYVRRGTKELSFTGPVDPFEFPFDGTMKDFHAQATQMATILASIAGAYLAKAGKITRDEIQFTVTASDPS